MKRIIFVIGDLNLGGAEKSLVRLCAQLNEDKYDISVLSLFGRKCPLSEYLPEYVKQYYVSREKTISFAKQYSSVWMKIYFFSTNKLWSKKRTNNKVLRFIYRVFLRIENKHFISYVKNLFKSIPFDISVGCLEGLPSVVSTNCFSCNKRFIFYAHGSVDGYYGDDDAFEKCDRLIAKSEKLKENIIRIKNYNPQKIIVLHNVYDIENIKKQSLETADLIEDTKSLHIITVGRFHPDKGQISAILAAAKLKSNGVDFLWIFVGNDKGEYAEFCKQKVVELGLENNIVFTGSRINPYPYFRICNIYVQPSKCEALPGTVVEALILEKPIVSTKTYGALELIKDGDNGLLCGFEPDDIYRRIMELVSNYELREKLIEGSRKTTTLLEHEIEKYDKLFLSND